MTAIARMLVMLVILLSAGATRAQNAVPRAEYPSRPVKVLLPFSPGGVVDVMGRLLAQKLSDQLGQNFYVENHGGGGGNIGAAMVQAAAPDGYTLLISSSSFLINPGLQRVPYDPVGGFTAITIPSASASVLVVNPGQSARSMQELVTAIKANPGKYSYASTGVGSTPHLQGEMFRLAFGLDMVHVPYGGGGPALQSAVAGHTPIAFTALPPAIPLVRGGQVRALAIIGPRRVAALPDVPTMTEAGLPGQETETILVMLAPAGTPKRIVDLLNREVVKILALPEVLQKLETLGFAPVGTSPEASAARITAELELWAKVIRNAKIQSP
ncbi:MAG: tripartite tricarboxylate transporter substrate binding protein [Hyphomicrobiales bacterium]|nr:tripartite tricarboxylate transporter substrate binding protein [Hyphomicrobiales bacterium]